MLPCKIQQEDDYRQRIKLLTKYGFISLPDLKNGIPFRLANPEALADLSLALFTGWLFTGLWNQSKPKIRLTVVPLNSTGTLSGLVLSFIDTDLAPPGHSNGGWQLVDKEYFECPLSRNGGTLPQTATMELCPVVNRTRYNLGQLRRDDGGLIIPHSNAECCSSSKVRFWDYIGQTILTNPDIYGAAIGGTVLPLRIPFDFLELYLSTGAEVDTRALGGLLEETLLCYAVNESKISLGLPHVELELPFRSNEIDFMLYETAGKNKRQKTTPDPDWKTYLSTQSICIFEVTLGHRDDDDDDGEQRNAPREGRDHPKNKILNHLAISSLGFKRVQYSYITIFPHIKPAPVIQHILKNSASLNFSYWSLDDKIPGINGLVLGHRATPVPIATVKDWHMALVRQVQAEAKAFRAAI